MFRLLLSLTIPLFAYAAVQCYVGQKLFSYESNNAICAKFIPYGCAAQCEWKPNCTEHTSYSAFHGRRAFTSGLLVNAKSLLVLCCASLATRVETDKHGREKCVWRDSESISVLGPSIRTNPVLAPNHYIRDMRMVRDGDARVDIAMEVCQYVTERKHCDIEKMDDVEKRRYNLIKLRLQRSEHTLTSKKSLHKTQATAKDVKSEGTQTETDACSIQATTACGRSLHSQITACCKDRQACDRECLLNVQNTLEEESSHHRQGCTEVETNGLLSCLGTKTNNLSVA